MIPKVIGTERKARDRDNFGGLVEYIARDDPESLANGIPPVPPEDIGTRNLEGYYYDTREGRKIIAEVMHETAQKSTRTRRHPAYHFAVSWPDGEKPTREQIEIVVGRTVAAVRLEECETFWAVHRDTDHVHLHVLVNTVHPERGVRAGPPFRRDFALLHKACRELELQHEWARTKGAWVSVEPEPGVPLVMERHRAEARGLWKTDEKTKPAISQRAARAEHNLGGDSFQAWAQGAPADALHAALEKPGATWTDAHAALARFGISIEAKGSGMIVATKLATGRVLAAKASQLGRWATKGALEKRLGAYQPPARDLPDPAVSYAQRVEAERRGAVAADRRPDPDEKRAKAREARAVARAELAHRFEWEQSQKRAARKDERIKLRAEHAAERKALLEQQREERRQARQAKMKRADLSLLAYRHAKARESLQERQKQARTALSLRLPRNEVWRLWVEREAAVGDEAAKAALRGIKYREQRKAKEQRDAIDGEDLVPLRPLAVGNLRAEVDEGRQVVRYLGADGKERFTDTGPRIVMRDREKQSIEAALRIAAEKFGGHVDLQGSEEFRGRAAREAVRLGIGVLNEDLVAVVADECRRMEAGRETQRPTKPRSRGDDLLR